MFWKALSCVLDELHRVTPSREIILSAGVINTPQILLNSGIGDATYLKSLQIPVVHNLPSVGQNLSDHLGTTLQWTVNSTNTTDTIVNNATLFAEAQAEWESNRTGLLVTNGYSTQAGWFRMNESDPSVRAALEQFGDPAPDPASPHIEYTPLVSPMMHVSIHCDECLPPFRVGFLARDVPAIISV